MKFKGIEFRRTNKVVNLPLEFWYGDLRNHVMFGRICEKGAPGAIETTWTRTSADGEETPIFAIAVERAGHHRTNMMRGKDGWMYLYLDGKCYIRNIAKSGFFRGDTPKGK